MATITVCLCLLGFSHVQVNLKDGLVLYSPNDNNTIIIDSCAAPSDLKIGTLSETSLLVQWKPSAYTTGYELEYKDKAGSTWSKGVTTSLEGGLIQGLVPGTTYEIRLRSKCATANSVWVLGEFKLGIGPACQPPFELNTTDIMEKSVTLHWNVQPMGIGVNVQYALIGTDNWQNVGVEITERSLKLSVDPGTNYEWRVQTACAAGPSLWIKSNFSTPGLAPCRPPFDLFAFNITGNSVFLGWSAWLQEGSHQYEVEFKESVSDNWIRTPLFAAIGEAAYIDTLQPVTSYDWRVRVVCDTGYSEWVVSTFMTTNASPIDPRIVLVSDFKFEPDQCSPAHIAFSNQSVATQTTISSMSWDFGDGSSSSISDPEHSYSKTGSYNVTLTITDANGRISTKLRQLVIAEMTLTFANTGTNMVVCSKDPVQLKATGGEKYEWLPCIGLNLCNSADPILTPGLHENYIVKVTDKNGCTDTASISIRYVDPAKNIFIPNAFTPNNDGLNDLFKPLANIPGNPELRIFDRFGNVIYAAKDIHAAWDGTYKGKAQPPGSYPYLIRTKGEGHCANREIKGTVSIIR